MQLGSKPLRRSANKMWVEEWSLKRDEARILLTLNNLALDYGDPNGNPTLS
jgi:hypothetical protein